MQKVLTAKEMGEVDRLTTEKYGIPSITLMENAATEVARIVVEKLGGSVDGKSVLILCGPGNNGGDGAALARILWAQGGHTTVTFVSDISKAKGDAKANFDSLMKLQRDNKTQPPRLNLFTVENIQALLDDEALLTSHNAVVDAMFGTGLSRPLKEKLASIVSKINSLRESEKDTVFVSVDMPSGLDSDQSRQIGNNIASDVTVTFTSPKLANVLPPASNFNGELHVVDIGSPKELIDSCASKTFLAEKEDARVWLIRTKFSNDSYKTKRGNALLIVGSKKYSGAAVLAGTSAMMSGAGMVTVVIPESAFNAVSERVQPEVMVRGVAETDVGSVSATAFREIEEVGQKSDVIAIGSGLDSSNESTRNLVRKVVENRKTPMVIDADGLNALSPFRIKGSDKHPLILTPHEGEFGRLLGTEEKEYLEDRVESVREFAQKHHVILVLKGEKALIAEPGGMVVVNPTGNSGLGKAGNGDNLTGIIAGFIAQGLKFGIDVFETVIASVYVAGLAGDIAAKKFGKRAMQASDVRDCLVDAFREIEEDND